MAMQETIITTADELIRALAEAPSGSVLTILQGELTTGIKITKSLTLKGQGSVIIHGPGQRSVIKVEGDDCQVVLENLVLTDGRSVVGGGIQIHGKNHVEVRNCEISGNWTLQGGGGIYADAGDLVVCNSRIVGNTSKQGGGILLDRTAQGLVENTLITENVAEVGAGIALKAKSQIKLLDSTLRNNRLQNRWSKGEAIYTMGSVVEQPKIEIVGCSIECNSCLFCVNAGHYSGEVNVTGSRLPRVVETLSFVKDNDHNQYIFQGDSVNNSAVLTTAQFAALTAKYEAEATRWYPDLTISEVNELSEIYATLQSCGYIDAQAELSPALKVLIEPSLYAPVGLRVFHHDLTTDVPIRVDVALYHFYQGRIVEHSVSNMSMRYFASASLQEAVANIMHPVIEKSYVSFEQNFVLPLETVLEFYRTLPDIDKFLSGIEESQQSSQLTQFCELARKLTHLTLIEWALPERAPRFCFGIAITKTANWSLTVNEKGEVTVGSISTDAIRKRLAAAMEKGLTFNTANK